LLRPSRPREPVRTQRARARRPVSPRGRMSGPDVRSGGGSAARVTGRGSTPRGQDRAHRVSYWRARSATVEAWHGSLPALAQEDRRWDRSE
jgi:hypothetical protein